MPRRSYIVPIVILLFGLLAAKLLLTQVISRPVQSSSIIYEGLRGWPWPYSRSARTNDPKTGTPGAWVSTDFYWFAILTDVALLLIALATIGLLLRRRYRRFGRLLRFSLGEMLILVTITAIACGWVSVRYRQRQHERQVFASFPAGTFSTHEEYRGPEWLRRIAPGSWLTIFDRAVEVSVNDTGTDATVAALAHILANAPYIHELDAHATLARHLTDRARFANIDEVCLFSNGTDNDIESAIAQIAGWSQVHKLTIVSPPDRSFHSDFDLIAGEMAAARKDVDRVALVREELLRSASSHPRKPPWLMQPQTNLTDRAMERLGQMPALQYLVIANSPDVTSDGIRRLAKSQSLISVSLTDVREISDESLKLLASRVKDLYLIQSDGGSRQFDPNKDTTIGADKLFSEPSAQK